MGARTTSHVVFLDAGTKGAKLGAQLGLSIEPGLKSVPGDGGRTLDGYILADRAEAKRVYDKATSSRIYAEKYQIPQVQGLATKLLQGRNVNLNPREQRIVGRVVSSFLDIATTGMNRATHYNTKEDQARAEQMAHAALFGIDRQTYGILNCLNGLTDNARKTAAWLLLKFPSVGRPSDLQLQMERELVQALIQSITAPRMFRLFQELRQSGVNNSRTRRIMLGLMLGSDKLPWWSVKYRRKMRDSLQHAFGKRRASIVARVCRKTAWTRKERGIMDELVRPYAKDLTQVKECLAFVLGSTDGRWKTELLRQYVDARDDLSLGRKLPPEVLEGIRSVYHPHKSHDDVLRLTARSGAMTDGQKIGQQRRIERAGVRNVEFDPRRYDAVKLYIYAYERGMTGEIRDALDEKARQAASALPMSAEGAVVILDASKSMVGSGDQKLRPMASALSMVDMFVEAGARKIVVGGKDRGRRLVRPAGDTSLALPVAKAIRDYAPTAVYVVSDGYDNTPAGRFAETVQAIRKVGVHTPIYHLNPVAAAEVASVRQLAPGIVPTIPVQNAKAYGTTMLRQALEQDPLSGLKALLRKGQRALTNAKTGRAALPTAKERDRPRNGQKVREVMQDLSDTMKSGLHELYGHGQDGRVRYRGLVHPNTVNALARRKLIKVSGADFIHHTDLGRDVFQSMTR
jgi:hypothetical protein